MTEYLSSSSSAGGATNPHEIGGGGDPSSIVRWEKANQHAYQVRKPQKTFTFVFFLKKIKKIFLFSTPCF